MLNLLLLEWRGSLPLDVIFTMYSLVDLLRYQPANRHVLTGSVTHALLQIIVALMARGGHAHVRLAAAGCLAQLVAARHNKKFVEALNIPQAAMLAWSFRDDDNATRPNASDPAPIYSLDEMLATLLACLSQTRYGRIECFKATSLSIIVQFMAFKAPQSRDIIVTSLAGLVRPAFYRDHQRTISRISCSATTIRV